MAKVLTDGRCAFALEWYDDEAEAEARGREVREAGHTYNGGWFHGTPCGREPRFDTTRDGKTLYAVTV